MRVPMDGILRSYPRRKAAHIRREIGHPPSYHLESLDLGLRNVVDASVTGTEPPPSELLFGHLLVCRILNERWACNESAELGTPNIS